MRKWKCTVCGYIHIGDEPPDKCPVCGAPKSRFVEVSEPETETPKPEPAQVPEVPFDSLESTASDAAAESDTPETVAEAEEPAETLPHFADSRYRRLFETMTKYHVHPIAVHIPNGLLPVTVAFIFLSALFTIKGMATAGVYNMAVVAIAMPLVLFSGWVDWKNRFNGALTQIFKVKIVCGIVVTITAWILFIWLLVDPEVLHTAHSLRVAFFVINLIMLGAATTAGWYGGKLVFRD